MMRLLKILYIFLCSTLFIACGDDDENSNLGDWERVDCPFAVSAILDFGNYIHVVRTDGVLFLYDGKNFEQTNVRMDLEGKYASVFPEYGVNIFKTSNKLFILGEDSYYVRSNDSKDFKKSFPIPSDSENIVCCAGKVFTYSFGRVYNHTADKWEDIRIEFIGGIRGLKELEKRADSDMKVSFSMLCILTIHICMVQNYIMMKDITDTQEKS